MNQSFAEKVYELTRKIPKGRVTTYKEIANTLGTNAYRAVGTALARNPAIPKTSCHRVVNSCGMLSGYANGLSEKEKLLKSEGVEIKNGKIDLGKYGFAF